MGTKNTSITDLDSAPVGQDAELASKEAVSAKVVKADAPVIGNASAKQRRYVISIASTETDSTPVKVGVNGEMTLIPRNTKVNVGQGIMSALQDAVVEVITQDGGKTVSQNQPRFPMSIHEIIEADAK